ncbi:MAG: hypothetical protein EAY75_08990 [Bacteroidetes bacterium]|nr:MAG: hypothetical protein EAY75_08990 [Bacteroidota bacterium]
MKKKFLLLAVPFVALSLTSVQAQFTNKLEEVCFKANLIEGSGTITFPVADFAICAYTTQVSVGGKWVDVKVNEKTPQSGKYAFKYTLPAGVTVSYPISVRTVTNRQTASVFTITGPCGSLKTETLEYSKGNNLVTITKTIGKLDTTSLVLPSASDFRLKQVDYMLSHSGDEADIYAFFMSVGDKRGLPSKRDNKVRFQMSPTGQNRILIVNPSNLVRTYTLTVEFNAQ